MKKLIGILVVLGALAAIAKVVLPRPDVRTDTAPAVVRVNRRAPEAVVR
jgi:hypothetical protein